MNDPDPVAEALRVAARHQCGCFENAQGGCPQPSRHCLYDASTAIAAFLRALPDWHVIPPGRAVSAAYLMALAAAVERAAREGRE